MGAYSRWLIQGCNSSTNNNSKLLVINLPITGGPTSEGIEQAINMMETPSARVLIPIMYRRVIVPVVCKFPSKNAKIQMKAIRGELVLINNPSNAVRPTINKDPWKYEILLVTKKSSITPEKSLPMPLLMEEKTGNWLQMFGDKPISNPN